MLIYANHLRVQGADAEVARGGSPVRLRQQTGWMCKENFVQLEQSS